MLIEFFSWLNETTAFLANNPIYIYGILSFAVVSTILLKGVQFRYFKHGVKFLLQGDTMNRGASSFQSAALAVGGRVGSGNIAGVTFALIVGGPGAIFWMWVVALFGMATSFVESTLGQVYKTKDTETGGFVGGPHYYIKKGLGPKWHWFGNLYAIILIATFGLLFISLQIDTIQTSAFTAFNINEGTFIYFVVMLILMALIAYVAFGGMKTLMDISAKIVPFITISYLGLVLFTILTNLWFVPIFFETIFSSAFSASAITGATIGIVISTGVKRGIFSNESGQGSGAIAAAAAGVKHPAEQGFAQSVTIFIDTILVCTATAFVVIFAASSMGQGTPESAYNTLVAGSQSGAEVATIAFDYMYIFGAQLLAIFLFFFAFTSVIAEIAYGQSSVKYLSQGKSKKHTHKWIILYNIAVVSMVVLAPILSTATGGAIFDIADNFASLLFYTNVIAMILLFPVVLKVLNDYKRQERTGKEIKFNPEELNIKGYDKEVWK